jgi:hypothetical protein
MFLTAIISTVLYSVIFLVLRGTLVMRGGIRLQLDPNSRWTQRVGSGFEEYHRFVVSIAWSMLWYVFVSLAAYSPHVAHNGAIRYPLAYLVLVTPSSVTLLFELSGMHVLAFNRCMCVHLCFRFPSLVVGDGSRSMLHAAARPGERHPRS